MDKAIWKITEEWFYFLGNVLVGVRVAFLPECPLVLSLLKHRGVWGIFELKKMRNPNRRSPLNSSIEACAIRFFFFFRRFMVIIFLLSQFEVYIFFLLVLHICEQLIHPEVLTPKNDH